MRSLGSSTSPTTSPYKNLKWQYMCCMHFALVATYMQIAHVHALYASGMQHTYKHCTYIYLLSTLPQLMCHMQTFYSVLHGTAIMLHMKIMQTSRHNMCHTLPVGLYVICYYPAHITNIVSSHDKEYKNKAAVLMSSFTFGKKKMASNLKHLAV